MKFEKLENLESKRIEKGLTQAQLAKAIGISQNGYSEKAQGVKRFHHDEIRKILKVLDCEYDEIF